MAIYRGPGGAGDANSDITINLVTELTQEAEDHKDAAASSAAAALASEQAAAQSETNASPVNAIVSEITTVAGISSDVTTVSTNNANVTTVATNIADVNSVAAIDSDVTTVATNDVNVTTVSTNIANVNTVAGINSDVTTVAGISTDVTAVVADATDIGTVATDLAGSDTIGTVAGNIANVNTVAGISSDVTAVVADQADIGTVATNIANVNTVAGVSTDVTTVAGINADVTAVAADATDIGTVATNIANVNTTAAGIANVNTVATNIAAVQTAGTNIADIQTVATEVQKVIDVANDLNEATSEIDVVAASIANVDAVGTNIANVNTVANNLTDVNAFGETYKISATAPTSPTEGDLWYDTTSDILKVYNGGSWQNAGSSVNGTSSRGDFVATSGQTTFTLTGGYDSGYVDVYLNGVKQVPTTDFTATNGSDIVFGVGLTAGDEVSVVAYGTFALADHYTKSQLDGGQLDNRYYTETEVDTIVSNIDALPDQTGHAGQYLTTDGTTADWATVDLTTKVDKSGDTMTGDLNFGDNVKAQFGASNDLQIYHDGSNSYIDDAGTGNLNVRAANNFYVYNADGSKTLFRAADGAGNYLYYDNNQKLNTSSTGVAVTGDMTLASSGAVNSELRSDFAGLQLGTTSNHYLAFRTNNTERVRIDTSGNMSVTGTVTATSFSGSGAGLTGVPTGDFYFDSSSNIFSMSSAGTDPYTNIGASNNSYKTFYVPGGGMAIVSSQNRDMYLSARNNTNLRLNGNSFSSNPATWVADGNAVVVVNTGSSSQYFTVGLASSGTLMVGSMGLS